MLNTLPVDTTAPTEIKSAPTRQSKAHERNLRVFQLMLKHDLFSYTLLEVGVGKLSATIDFKDLGLSSDQIGVLRKLRAKGASILMFEDLKDAGYEIRKMLNRVKTRYMTFTGVAWVTTDKQLPEVVVELKQITQRKNELREQLLDAIPQQRSEFLRKLKELVHTTNELLFSQGKAEIDLHTAIEHYAKEFPTPQQVWESFDFTVEGPDLIPSIRNQADQSTDLQLAMNRFRSAELEQHQIAALEEAFEAKQKRIKAAIAEGVRYAETRVLKTVADILQKVDRDDFNPDNLNPRTKRAIETNLADLEAMLKLPFVPDSFAQLVGDVQVISALNDSKESLQERIDKLVQKMAQEHSFTYTPAAAGHRSGAVLPLRKKQTASS